MARRTKEDANKTREQLIDAAETVFHAKGVSSTSLNDIANEAGVTRGAIYWHFKNKHDIFEAMISRQEMPLDMLRSMVEDPETPDPLGRLKSFLLFVTQEIARDERRRRVCEIIFQKCELIEANEPLGSRHRQNFIDGAARLSEVMQNAIRRGQLPADLEIDRAIVHLHVQLTGLIYMWLLLPDSFDMEQESERAIETYFYSLPCCFSKSGGTTD
ncbi:TetR family transcriptional regulator [Marinobacter sp. 1Y8]